MGRKQITYARKRNRNRATVSQESGSSPLEDISDPEQYLTHPEMARRVLKRSRRSSSTSSPSLSKDHTHGHGFKKLRTFLPEENEQEGGPIFPLNDNISLCTPYPTQLSEDQIFKLKSSRGLPLSPDHEFSPVPVVSARSFSPVPNSMPTQIIHKNTKQKTGSLLHKTSSRSLKENTSIRSTSKSAPKSAMSTTGNSSRRTRSRSKAHVSRLPLASPFTSQPSSPHKHPSQSLYTQPITKPTKIHKVNIITATVNSKCTLSDTHYNPNLPQAQSTANSPARPARETEGVKARRPSAPSSTSYRPDVASWLINISPSNKGDTAKSASNSNMVRSPTIFDRGSGNGGRGLNVDFNRPPSQLSFTSAYDENFFGDAQGVSTPFSLKGHKKLRMYEDGDPMGLYSSEDEDEYRYLNNYAGHQFGDPNTNEVQPLKEYSERGHSTWITDSLISSPTAFSAYNQSKYKDNNKDDFPDVQMLGEDEDEITLGLGSSLRLDPGPCFEDTLLSYGGAQRTNQQEDKAADLKELFEGLEIAYAGSSVRPMLTRSRSLDLDPLLSPPRLPANKDTVQIQPLESPAYISPSKAKHLNANPGISADANKRGTRDRRGTIRASDFPPAPARAEDVALLGGARRTRSGTVVGPARNRRERSGTVSAAVRPIGLSTVTHALDKAVGRTNTEVMDIDESMQRPDPADADVPMFIDNGENEQAGFHGDREDDDAVEMDPMNIVSCWRDVDWPWTVAEPPSPVRSRRMRVKNRKRGPGLSIDLKLPKGWELWQMREHDEDDGEDDPLNLLR